MTEGNDESYIQTSLFSKLNLVTPSLHRAVDIQSHLVALAARKEHSRLEPSRICAFPLAVVLAPRFLARGIRRQFAEVMSNGNGA